MSSEEYQTESIDTTRSSEYAVQRSESDELRDNLFQLSEIEKEIEDEHYDDFKTQVEVLVQLGKEKLKPLQLTDCYTNDRPGMYFEILPKIIFDSTETETGLEEIDFPKPIFRRTIDQGTIASLEHDSSYAQTLRSNLLNSWSQYEPRLFPEEDSNTVISSESFNLFLKIAEKGILQSLIQNRTADSFFRELKSLFREECGVEASKKSTLYMSGSFICFEGNEKQIIQDISWHPTENDFFVVSTLCDIKFEKRTSKFLKAPCNSFISYMWSCKNQFIPKLFLEHFTDITLHKFNPSFPNIVAGGSLSGQLVLWNLEQAELLTGSFTRNDENQQYSERDCSSHVLHHSVSSNPEHNHACGINDFEWIPCHFEVLTRGNVKVNASNESYQIVTCGSDGVLKFWDLRTQNKPGSSMSKMLRQADGKWEPFHSVEMVLQDEKTPMAITKFALREASKNRKFEACFEDDKTKKKISTEFYAGCDDGKIFCGNFKLIRDDMGKYISPPPLLYNSSHSGPITAIALSPFLLDVFISTGFRTVSIWKHEIKAFPIYSRDMHTRITSAQWSNTRAALFILGYEDGSVEMWDFLQSIYEPSLVHVVSVASVSSISIQMISEEKYIVAIGDSQGIVYILSLPSHLWKPFDIEQKLIEEFINKESERLQTASTETLGSKKAPEDLKKEAEIKVDVIDEQLSDESIEKSYSDFIELQQIQLQYLGIIKENDKVE